MLVTLYNFIRFLSQEKQTGSISPEQFSQAFNQAQWSVFRAESKDFELTSDNRANLAPFVMAAQMGLTNGKGNFIRDFYKLLDIETAGGVPVDMIDQARWSFRKKSCIEPPEDSYPIGRLLGAVDDNNPNTAPVKIEVLPATLSAIYITYLSAPKELTINFSISADGRSYDINPDQPAVQWLTPMQPRIAEATLSYLGISLKDNYLIEFEKYKQQLENGR